MRTWAVVVARHGSGAKSRLSAVLSPEERSALAAAMLVDVIRAAYSAGLAGTIAVLDRPLPSEGEGVRVLPDPGAGLDAAVDAGLRAATELGAEAALVLSGDIPLVGPDDLRALAALVRHAERAVVVATDRHGTGTNALGLRPPRAIAPAFGPGSAARHLTAAVAAGAVASRVELPGIALDVDTPEDLDELTRRHPRGATEAALTRAAAR